MRAGMVAAVLLFSSSISAQVPQITKVIVMPAHGVPAPVMRATVAAIASEMGADRVVEIRQDAPCIDGGFDSDPCRALLQGHGADTLMIVTYYPVDASRQTPVLSLGMYGSAQVGVRADLPLGDAAGSVAERLIRQAVAQWPDAHRVEVVFEGAPAGAGVRIHGGPIEALPASFRLSAGTHHATITSPGYLPEEREFEVRLGEPLVLQVDLARSADGASPDPITPPSARSESAWPSYVLGGVLAVAGGALLVSPLRTAIHSGECVDCTTPNVTPVSFGGRSIALLTLGALASLGGLTLLIGRWWTVDGAADTNGARLQLRGTF